MSGGSVQLRQYRRARRDGATLEEACVTSGLGKREAMVRDACKLIAAKERPVIVAHLEQYQEKDGIKATLKLPATGEAVLAMHEACGREVLIVTSGYDDVAGEAGPAQIDADQPAIPGIGDEYAEAA